MHTLECVTFSIVAYDPESGEVGAAIASGSFGVGKDCVWARSGVGAVVTQSFTNVSYGPLGLALMAAGNAPDQAIDALRQTDGRAAFRQVAMVSAAGDANGYTGAECVAAAGHHGGTHYSAQANMASSEEVWRAMADAYQAAGGSLACRLVDGIEAGYAAGGDWRGLRSAAVLVVAGQPSARPWETPVVDLRVDEHDNAICELRRLLRLDEWFARLGRIGPGASVDDEVAAAFEAGLSEPEPTWAALAAASEGGDREAARRRFEALLKTEPRYAEIARRLPGVAEVAGLEPVE
jgi:uncharacterized Ntn-hydrolase superfamily protein